MNIINAFKGMFSYLFKRENRQVLWFIAFTALILIILMQRSCNSSLRSEIDAQKGETQRVKNNYEAEKDSVKHYKINDSIFRAERLGFVLTLNELNTNYKYLLTGFEDFKKNPPKVIINQPLLIRETIKEVPVTAIVDPNGNGNFKFSFETNYADNNYRKLSGFMPYSSKFFNKADSIPVNYKDLPYAFTLNPGTGTFDLEQRINIKLGLFQDPKTKKVKVAVNTSYPGITFSGLEAFDIMEEELIKKQQQGGKKVWGVGFSVGYGAGLSLKTNQVFFGPQIGVGLHYTPKWAQWGK
jgi:hypothetical protein